MQEFMRLLLQVVMSWVMLLSYFGLSSSWFNTQNTPTYQKNLKNIVQRTVVHVFYKYSGQGFSGLLLILILHPGRYTRKTWEKEKGIIYISRRRFLHWPVFLQYQPNTAVFPPIPVSLLPWAQ